MLNNWTPTEWWANKYPGKINTTEASFQRTCVYSLPAHGKRSSSLDDVAGDGAAVVPSGSPG